MSWLKRFELLDPPSALLYHESSSFWCPPPRPLFADDEAEEQLFCAIDILRPAPTTFDPFTSPFRLLDAAAAADDLLLFSPLRRFQERTETELALQSLSDRIAALETGFARALKAKPAPAPAPRAAAVDRKFKWTTEIKGADGDGFDRKYKLIALAKAGEAKNLKWMAEYKGKGKDAPASRTYTFETLSTPAAAAAPGKKKEKKLKKPETRVVEIQDEPTPNPAATAIRKAFAVNRSKGKRKELSVQDAAVIIQLTFRAHLVRRAQVLRGLRDLAVAKAKLKEIRSWFFNFSYRRLLAKDAGERQRFSEKIIVLLLTVEAIEGPDYMVRAAKKSMVDELEGMLEVVDPQPAGRLGSMKRRTFDLPDGPISKEMSMGVAGVVQMINEEGDNSD